MPNEFNNDGTPVPDGPADGNDAGAESGKTPTSHEDVLRSGRDHEVDDQSRRQAMRLPIDPQKPKDDMSLGFVPPPGTIDAPEPVRSVIPDLQPIIVDVPDTPPPSDAPDPSPTGIRHDDDEPTEFAPPPDPELLPQPWWRTSKPVKWAAVGVVTVIVAAGITKIVVDDGTEGSNPPQATAVAQENAPDSAATTSPEPPSATATPPEEDEPAASSSASGTTADSVDDPAGDLSRAFSDLDGIDPEREDGGVTGQSIIDTIDIAGVTVNSTAPSGPTVVEIAFYGDVQNIVTEIVGTLRSRSVSADVLLIAPNGEVLNVLFKPDGTIKISDIPAGMSIASEWSAPDMLRIVIQGLALEVGTQVDVMVLVEAYGGIMGDEASLTTKAG